GLDAATGGGIALVYASGDFSGRRDETAVVYGSGRAARVLLVGMGKEAGGPAAIRRAAAAGAKRARTLGVSKAAFFLTPEARGQTSVKDAARAAAEGLPFGAWQYTDLKAAPE